MASISRMYRPRTFAEITGQEGIKETLRLEVETGKLGHAYLFAGPRGVGKTTIARVFAKALNCLQSHRGEPCGTCASCVELNTGHSLDVIEMDAASNTGVDNVREAIIEHVRFVPQSRKFKVYILDEAHMLSTSAWNALLKTLEEPPPYAVFILITTELHKVPATIQSRCQRFDFRRVPDALLKDRINHLAELEGVKIDPDVNASIVAKADGCVRDAESLLGQLLSLGETHLTTEVAQLVLPVSRLPIAANVLEVWSRRELGSALSQIGELEDQGISLLTLFDDLIQAIRFLLLATDSSEWREKLSRGDEGERKLATLVRIYPPEELADMALLCMERRRDAKQGADVRFCMELTASAVVLRLLPHASSGASETAPPSNPPEPPRPSSPPPAVKTEPSKFAPPASSEASSSSVSPSISASQTEEVAMSLDQVQVRWSAILKAIDAKSPSLTFILKISRPIATEGNVVILQFQYAFHRDKLIEDLKNRYLVESCMRELLNAPHLTIQGVIKEDASVETRQPTDMMSSILQAFDGQIIEEPGMV